MTQILCLILTLFSSTALATDLPLETHGSWVSDSIVADDGAYGKHYRSWLILNENFIDEIITLGAHYTKTKFVIRSKSDDGKLELVDVEEPWNILQASLILEGQTLRFCRRSNCTVFLKTSETPSTEDPFLTTPLIEITTIWCVDKDCTSKSYLPLENEQLFNLNSGVRAQGGMFDGPSEFETKYGLKLSLSSIAYRMTNRTHELDAYSSIFYLMGAYRSQFTERLTQSPLLNLQEGLLTELSATLNKHSVTVRVFVKKI